MPGGFLLFEGLPGKGLEKAQENLPGEREEVVNQVTNAKHASQTSCLIHRQTIIRPFAHDVARDTSHETPTASIIYRSILNATVHSSPSCSRPWSLSSDLLKLVLDIRQS